MATVSKSSQSNSVPSSSVPPRGSSQSNAVPSSSVPPPDSTSSQSSSVAAGIGGGIAAAVVLLVVVLVVAVVVVLVLRQRRSKSTLESNEGGNVGSLDNPVYSGEWTRKIHQSYCIAPYKGMTDIPGRSQCHSQHSCVIVTTNISLTQIIIT